MPRSKEQFAEMRSATKQRIESAALHLFARKGFGATNVQDIADQSGISIGLLYRHYKTKEQLFHELTQFAQTGLDRLAERLESDAPPSLLMRQFIQEVYHDMQSGDDLAHLMIVMSQASSDSSHPDEIPTRNLIRVASKLIRRGQQLGEFAAGDSDEMAIYLFATLQGLAELKVRLRDEFAMPSPAVMTAFLYMKGADL